MKLPVGLGSRLFFRVVFPGFITTAALWRLIDTIHQPSWLVTQAILFPVLMVLLGWIYLVLDQPIYMLFEGRRFWPEALKVQRLCKLRKHLEDLTNSRKACWDLCDNAELDEQSRLIANLQSLEFDVEISQFPIDETTGKPYIRWPTLLGNLIYTYESYPSQKYGMDGVFFWPRIWISLPKDVRDELDTKQAQVDGMLYGSLALLVSGAIFLVYALVEFVQPGTLSFPVYWAFNFGASAALFIAGRLLYKISLFEHFQYGEYFKAVFDQYRDLIKLDETTRLVSEISDNPKLRFEEPSIKAKAVWRYLKWHKIRRPGSDVSEHAGTGQS